jgi:hypothetical protein
MITMVFLELQETKKEERVRGARAILYLGIRNFKYTYDLLS